MKLNRTSGGLVLSTLMLVFSLSMWASVWNESDAQESVVPRSENSAGTQLSQLLDERKNQLKERLGRLRGIKASMGENHPSIDRINEQIADAEREADAWDVPIDELMELSDQDVRAMLVQLMIRVERLESEVKTLKSSVPASRSPRRGLGLGLGTR